MRGGTERINSAVSYRLDHAPAIESAGPAMNSIAHQ